MTLDLASSSDAKQLIQLSGSIRFEEQTFNQFHEIFIIFACFIELQLVDNILHYVFKGVTFPLNEHLVVELNY